MSAIDQVFRELRAQGRKALIPFVTAGDPDLQFTADLVRLFDQCGCAIAELGIPYSDPIADGPVIQASYTRALAQRIHLADILGMATRVSGQVSMPLVTMVSYAIVHRHGMQRYVDQAQQAGIAGAIVPDLPVEESQPLAEICRRQDFSLVQLVAPTTPRDRALKIAQRSSGFLYYVSVTGITGERSELPAELLDNVAWLREQTELPICIGFGVSRVEHVQRLAPVADGLIVGSAIMRQVANVQLQSRTAVLQQVGHFVKELISALPTQN